VTPSYSNGAFEGLPQCSLRTRIDVIADSDDSASEISEHSAYTYLSMESIDLDRLARLVKSDDRYLSFATMSIRVDVLLHPSSDRYQTRLERTSNLMKFPPTPNGDLYRYLREAIRV